MAISLFWSHGDSSAMSSYASAAADGAAAAARSAEDRARDADERLDQLLLVCAAMWELVRERTGLTEEDLVTRVAMIDARDGQADGKMTYTPIKCTKCNRTVFPKHRKCLYCGQPVQMDSVFKGI